MPPHNQISGQPSCCRKASWFRVPSQMSREFWGEQALQQAEGSAEAVLVAQGCSQTTLLKGFWHPPSAVLLQCLWRVCDPVRWQPSPAPPLPGVLHGRVELMWLQEGWVGSSVKRPLQTALGNLMLPTDRDHLYRTAKLDPCMHTIGPGLSRAAGLCYNSSVDQVAVLYPRTYQT
jgi:hypothetical protein